MTAPDYDTIVLGAGPAGASAAIEAARLGLRVCLLDEGHGAGGQVYRPTQIEGSSRPDPDGRAGAALRAALANSAAECRFEHRVWSVEPGFRVAALGPAGPITLTAPTLIVATGAQERHVPVLGWTLPGVFGLAAATVLLKTQKMLPGRRVVVAGTGPLLYAVAAGILAAGGTVAAVMDGQPAAAWLRQMPALLSRPRLIGRGLRWRAAIVARSVPVLSGWAVKRIEGEGRVERVTVAPTGGGQSRSFAADSACLGYGLVSATEVTRLLGAAHEYDDELGGWAVRTDDRGGTSVPGLFACGDGARVLGAAVAPILGRLAAIGAAGFLRRADGGGAAALAERLRRMAPFGRAVSALSRPPPGLIAAMAGEAVVCRCEGLERSVLDRAIAAGAATLPALKAATRCGMGPCGGRMCEYAAASLIALGTGQALAAIAPGRPRPPLRPVPIDAVCGAFEYDDLPIPAPAPL